MQCHSESYILVAGIDRTAGVLMEGSGGWVEQRCAAAAASEETDCQQMPTACGDPSVQPAAAGHPVQTLHTAESSANCTVRLCLFLSLCVFMSVYCLWFHWSFIGLMSVIWMCVLASIGCRRWPKKTRPSPDSSRVHPLTAKVETGENLRLYVKPSWQEKHNLT